MRLCEILLLLPCIPVLLAPSWRPAAGRAWPLAATLAPLAALAAISGSRGRGPSCCPAASAASRPARAGGVAWLRAARGWALGSLLALPLGKLLSDAVGIAFVQTPFSYTFSTAAVGIRPGLVIGLAALASFLPAWSAAQVTIRDALADEERRVLAMPLHPL